ncbi:histidine kinase, partial [Streptomyces sp. NPDC002138]
PPDPAAQPDPREPRRTAGPAAGAGGGLPVRKAPGGGLPRRVGGAAPSGEHTHAQAPDGHGDWVPRQGSHPLPEPEAVTGKGLPKRTPRTVATPATAAAPAAEPKRVDAEELRRRLGGFYQGSRDGRRVVEAELAEGPTDPGDTAQEART